MPDTNKDLIRRWFDEIWNQGQHETVNELLEPGAPAYGLAGDEPLRGSESLKAFQRAFRAAFSNLRLQIDDIVAEGDDVAVRFSANALHTGPFHGVEATGVPVLITGMCICRFKDGRMTESWNQYDLFGLLKQIGAIP